MLPWLSERVLSMVVAYGFRGAVRKATASDAALSGRKCGGGTGRACPVFRTFSCRPVTEIRRGRRVVSGSGEPGTGRVWAPVRLSSERVAQGAVEKLEAVEFSSDFRTVEEWLGRTFEMKRRDYFAVSLFRMPSFLPGRVVADAFGSGLIPATGGKGALSR